MTNLTVSLPEALTAYLQEQLASGQYNTADDYIRLTLFFATALFFAGITASFKSRFARLLLLTAATVTLVIAGGLLTSYPIA